MTFGVFFQLYDYMIYAGSPAFMAVSNGVNPTYEKSQPAMLFYKHLYFEKLGGLNCYFKEYRNRNGKGMANQNTAIGSMLGEWNSKFLRTLIIKLICQKQSIHI